MSTSNRIWRDFSGSHRRVEEWVASGNPEQVAAQIDPAALRWGGKWAEVITRTSHSVEYHFGSRARYRLLGVWSSVRSRPITASIALEVAAAGTTHVKVEMVSDEGSAVAEIGRLASKQFEQAFEGLMRALREAARSISS